LSLLLLLLLLQAACELDAGLIPLLVNHLTSQQVDIRAAAASALADAVAQHPDSTSQSLASVVALYGEELDDDMDETRAAILLDDAERAAREAARQQQAATRGGVATALEALSGVLSGADVNAALDFLVNKGLAEPVDSIREAMVGAGMCRGRLPSPRLVVFSLGLARLAGSCAWDPPAGFVVVLAQSWVGRCAAKMLLFPRHHGQALAQQLVPQVELASMHTPTDSWALLLLLLLLLLSPGVALVEAHGEALAQELLPQFESYLNPDAAAKLGLQEDRYDLVREGVVVLLGMMAGHLAPGDDKVRGERRCG
jgi:hypothetical protein